MTTISTLVELGYDASKDGIERAYLDGLVTEQESVEIADTLDGGNSAKQPQQFRSVKFERALARFTIQSLGETEADAYRRFYKSSEHLHPAIVMSGPDGRWYAFGNRGTRRNHVKARKVVVLRGGGVN